jgi:CheY-like chemotaxis protein
MIAVPIPLFDPMSGDDVLSGPYERSKSAISDVNQIGSPAMSHALIIDDDMLVSRVVADRLVPLGFETFHHSWTEEQAVAAANLRVPDLMVVGDAAESGSAMNAARRISATYEVPVLMVTADSHRAKARLPDDAVFDGPFLLHEISTAIGQAKPLD